MDGQGGRYAAAIAALTELQGWLGDRNIKEFPAGDAPNAYWAWGDYLYDVMNICQEALK